MIARLLVIPLCFLLMAAAQSPHEAASALKEKHAELREALENNVFGSPVHLVSREGPDSISGEVYAVIAKPFAQAMQAMEHPADWCEIMFLHLNTKYCRASEGVPAVLDVAIGIKSDQPVEKAYRMQLIFGIEARSKDYMRVTMTAAEGPLSTRNYNIVFEAAPLDGGRSFVHFSYSYGYGTASKLAAEIYLGTVARQKVGFTVAGRTAGGEPVYVRGMRGAVERNTMRYYLAIDAYLDSLAAPKGEQQDKRLRDWFAATERYARQLHELNEDEYLTMKKKEVARQQEK